MHELCFVQDSLENKLHFSFVFAFIVDFLLQSLL